MAIRHNLRILEGGKKHLIFRFGKMCYSTRKFSQSQRNDAKYRNTKYCGNYIIIIVKFPCYEL